MCWMTLHELSPLGMQNSIVVGDEFSEGSLAAYDEHLHAQVFPPRNKPSVKELVADGHAKAHVKCSDPSAHQSRPRKDGKHKPYGHGWFMIVNPQNLQVLAVSCMHKPGGNEVVKYSLARILPMYKHVDCFVLDRNCAFMPHAKDDKTFKQIRFAHWPLPQQRTQEKLQVQPRLRASPGQAFCSRAGLRVVSQLRTHPQRSHCSSARIEGALLLQAAQPSSAQQEGGLPQPFRPEEEQALSQAVPLCQLQEACCQPQEACFQPQEACCLLPEACHQAREVEACCFRRLPSSERGAFP